MHLIIHVNEHLYVYYFVQYMGEKTQTSMILQSSEDDFKADKGCNFYKSATEHAPIIYMV